ncbi:Concanavalin A-like lectin/glucanase domain containing protein, partial [Rhypophila sp. PSN 637]
MAPFLPRRGHLPVPGRPVSTFKTLLLLLLATSAGLVSGQAYSFCNPLKEKCPPAPGFPSSEPYTSDFRTGSDSRIWTSVGKSSVPIKYPPGIGAVFSIHKQEDSPVLESDQYIFFGTVEVHLRAAAGQGIVNCIVLLSDTLDEIDFELLGGAPHRWLVQSNYFGKGETGLFENGETHYLPHHLPSSATTGQVHNYTVDWDRDKIVWFIDGVQVRRLDRHQARPVSLVPGWDNFPQTPARVRIGLWAGGDPGNEPGTIEWAGGVTSFDRGELPYEMVVEKVRIVNRYPAAAYWFKDFGGQWEGVEL